ncbi:MAG: 3-deoxy-manno-octulosonate cytidylyltransferase [Elusimicrobiota bacterium]|jgi:3-deoxy-manno-octulosonate cytidylyltransferase (CMP-KDO synthetase)|nr:3-deoxy-manno-octulosonate cytidylyltransferase [Elusimicrobiota bacterium]
MQINDVLIVIPARYGSTRLPAKLMETIEGKSVLQWVWEACKKARCADVIVATENQKIVDLAATFGAKAVMTSEACQSGTDRVFEAAKKTKAKFILNVQADEPFIQPAAIKKVAAKLAADKQADITTACYHSLDLKALAGPNVVKAVLNKEGRALYFSRSLIPFKRDNTPQTAKTPYNVHCGIYGYKRAALERFVKLPKSALENLEKLEQLRALEAGMTIKSVIIKPAGPAIDTLEDLLNARKFAKRLK